MKKYLFATFLLTTGILGCLCPRVEEHWNIVGMNLFFADTQGEVIGGQVQGDSLYLTVMLEPDFVQAFTSQPFTQTLHALTCTEPGYRGLSDPIASIELTSDNAFNSIPAGQPLDSLAQIWGMPLYEFDTEAYDWAYEYFQRVDFLIPEPPSPGSTHRFHIALKMKSGRSVERETQPLTWE